MTSEAPAARLVTPRLTMVALDLDAVEAALRGDRRALGRLLGADVPSDWPEAPLRERAMPVLRDRLVVDPTAAPYGTWAAIHAGTVVGAAGFKGRPDARGAVDLGYGILPAWRRQGLATEAARGLIEHVREDPAVRRVTADCHVRNGASIRVLERLGLTRVDERGELIYWELQLR